MTLDWIPTGASRKITPKEIGNRGIFPSNKVPGGIVEYESCLERDFFLLCNHAPDVTKFQHQPVTISYIDHSGKSRTYTPDAYVEFKDGKKALYEIKYEAEVAKNRELYAERWEKAREWGKERNIVFSTLTDEVIRTPRWFNVWFTLGSSKCMSLDLCVSRLCKSISEKGDYYREICLAFAESEGMEINHAAQVLCYAIYHGLVFLDSFSTRQISNRSLIRKRTRSDVAPFKSLWEELSPTRKSNRFNVEPVKEENIPQSTETPLWVISKGIPPGYADIVEKRIQVVKAWLNQPGITRTDEWRKAFCEKWRVCEKTVYNWVQVHRTDGIEGLIPKQKSGRKISFCPDALVQMEKGRLYYLSPLITLKQAYTKLKETCEENKVALPPESVFRTYIYNNTTAAEFARKRGKTYFKSHFTPALASFQGAFAPLQVVQMDNTRLDLFPVDSECRESLSTPYVTAAIDCYSRMVTGFNASFFPSSSQSVLDVLVQTILPKDPYVKTYNTQQNWPIQGFPVLILVDNGMDYRSTAVREFCIKFDVIIEFAPIRTPRYKALIEQWFNLLHNALVAEDVAGVRPILRRRLENPDLKPEADAVLTLQEIEMWLHKWMIDDYHFTNPYEDHAPAPYLRWLDYQRGETQIILPAPRSPPADQYEIDSLTLASFEHLERRLGYEGIVWEHLRYNNRELAHLYSLKGRETVEFLLNPRDIRWIWVKHPTSSKLFQVELASGWAQAIAKLHGNVPIHTSAWKKEVTRLKLQFKHRITPYLYQKEISRTNRQELVENAKKDTKSMRKQKEKTKETQRKSKIPQNEVNLGTALAHDEINPPASQEAGDMGAGKPRPARVKKAIDWSKVPKLPTDDFPTDF